MYYKILNMIFQNGFLGVFQKLIASKVNDHEGFHLMQNIIQHFPT